MIGHYEKSDTSIFGVVYASSSMWAIAEDTLKDWAQTAPLPADGCHKVDYEIFWEGDHYLQGTFPLVKATRYADRPLTSFIYEECMTLAGRKADKLPVAQEWEKANPGNIAIHAEIIDLCEIGYLLGTKASRWSA